MKLSLNLAQFYKPFFQAKTIIIFHNEKLFSLISTGVMSTYNNKYVCMSIDQNGQLSYVININVYHSAVFVLITI